MTRGDAIRARLRSAGWFLFPMLVGAGSYASTLRGKFVWDDTHIVGRWMLASSTLRSIFFPGRTSFGYFYKPLASFGSWLLFQLVGKEPFYWRLAGVMLHVASVPAVYVLLRDWLPAGRTDSWTGRRDARAMIGATVFACWPAGAQAITWIAARADLQLAICMLWGLVFHLRARDSGKTALPAAFLFLCGWLSKEPAIAFLPAAVAATVLLPPAEGAAKTGWRSWIASSLWLPYVAAALGYVAMRKWATGTGGGIQDTAALALHGGETIRTAFFAWGFYVRELLLLGDGTPYLENVPQDGLHAAYALFGGALILLAGIAALFPSRRALAFPAVWIVLFLGPALAVAADPPTVNQVAVRYLYLPGAGVAFLAGYIAGLVPLRRRWPAVLAGLAAVVALTWTIELRSRPWMDNPSLWERAWRDNPRSALVASNLGTLAFGRGDLDGAEKWYRIAGWTGWSRRLETKHHVLVNLAYFYAIRRQIDEARFTLRQASQYPGNETDNGLALVVMGKIGFRGAELTEKGEMLVSRRDLHAAIESFEAATRVDPLDDEAPLYLAVIYESVGELVLAREKYRRIQELALGDSPAKARAQASIDRLDRMIQATDGVKRAYYDAQATEFRGDPAATAAAYRKAVELAPDRVDLRVAEAEALLRAGKLDEAIAALREAKDAGVDSAQLSLNLGVYLSYRGRLGDALLAMIDASKLAPEWAKPVLLRAQLHERLGEQDRAIEVYREFLALDADGELKIAVRARVTQLETRTLRPL